jgi:hypothetical protein
MLIINSLLHFPGEKSTSEVSGKRNSWRRTIFCLFLFKRILEVQVDKELILT